MTGHFSTSAFWNLMDEAARMILAANRMKPEPDAPAPADLQRAPFPPPRRDDAPTAQVIEARTAQVIEAPRRTAADVETEMAKALHELRQLAQDIAKRLKPQPVSPDGGAWLPPRRDETGAVTAPGAKVFRRWLHTATGACYTEGQRCRVAGDMPINPGNSVVTYRGDDGVWWVRLVNHFEDGRFVLLDPQRGDV